MAIIIRHGLIVEKYGAALREMRLAIQAWIAPWYPYTTDLLHRVVFQLYLGTCARTILFWARALFVYKQLLDEVFVISGIIKVEVSVTSRSRRLRLISPIPPPSTYLPTPLYVSTYLSIYLSIYLSTYPSTYLPTRLAPAALPPGPPPGRCTNFRFPYPSQGLFSSLSSPQALPDASCAFLLFFFLFYANQAGLEPVTSLFAN